MAAPVKIDFLILTALRDEVEAVTPLLDLRAPTAYDVVGVVYSGDFSVEHSVVVSTASGPGKSATAAVLARILSRFQPQRVLMTGIAAGFGDHSVALGDILIPDEIVEHDFGKYRPDASGAVVMDHRGEPVRVSRPLKAAADALVADVGVDWPTIIRASRPDGTNVAPVFHNARKSLLGCGDQVVAAAEEANGWLRTAFDNRAIGLEMESATALAVAEGEGLEFLLIKGVQDDGTEAKDREAKDAWRGYVASASAAFAIELIRRWPGSGGDDEAVPRDIVSRHQVDARKAAESLEDEDPPPAFDYTVSTAASYVELRRRAFDAAAKSPEAVRPNAANPLVVLHGAGGSGKSRILRAVFKVVAGEGLTSPVYLRLRKPSVREISAELPRLSTLLKAASVPERTKPEVDTLAQGSKLLIILDGLNEVPQDVRELLVRYILALRRQHASFALVSDRFETLTGPEFRHAQVDPLDSAFVARVFDSQFGSDSYSKLSESLRKIYRRPFFLSLSLKTNIQFADQTTRGEIFQEFLIRHLGLDEPLLNELARVVLTYQITPQDKSLPSTFSEYLKRHAGVETIQKLRDAGVFSTSEDAFEHELWRDYLTARELARDESKWTHRVLDLVTSSATSLDCLSLTAELLPNADQRDEFVKALYDWNYLAAADRVIEIRRDDLAPAGVSDNVRVAVLAAVTEKTFDSVDRTSRRAAEILRHHKDPLARSLQELTSVDGLYQFVRDIDSSSRPDWFAEWQRIFTLRKPGGDRVDATTVIEALASPDSLIGWAAASAARRSTLSDTEVQRVANRLVETVGQEHERVVRWRAAHVLGAHPTDAAVDGLVEAAKSDSYPWVRYGAVRSLIEIAARAGTDIRSRAVTRLREVLEEGSLPEDVQMRRHILREVIETCFYGGAEGEWAVSMTPLIQLAIARIDERYRPQFEARAAEFSKFVQSAP
jgi:nucleoside phosphorylase